MNKPWIDKAIGYLSPRWEMQRAQARARAAMSERFHASYRGSVQTRLDSDWSTSNEVWGQRFTEANTLPSLRARARQLERNSVIAQALLNRCEENVVGQGMNIHATTLDEGWNRAARALWDDYWLYPEIHGLSGPETERMVFRSKMRDGDVGVIMLGDGRLQLVEGDLIETPSGKYTDRTIVDGVQTDRVGRPSRFHIASVDANGKRTSTAVEARDFIFLTRRNRVTQWRGEPCFTPVFNLFDQVEGYTDALIVAMRMAACHGLVFKTDKRSQRVGVLPATSVNGVAQSELEFEPGMIEYIGRDDSVEQIKPQQPGQQFDSVIAMLMRFAGMHLGLPLEMTMLDFSRTNYSSARGAMNVAQTAFKNLQMVQKDAFMSRVYRWRISKWVKEGLLTPRDDMWMHRVITAPWPFLDPIKEVQGQMMEVDFGVATEDEYIIARGKEPELVRAQRGRELEDKRKLGIAVMHATMTMPTDQGDPFQEGDDNTGEGDDPFEGSSVEDQK